MGEKALAKETIQKLWPAEVAQKSFIDYLWTQYDYTQLEAIEVCPLFPAHVQRFNSGCESTCIVADILENCPDSVWNCRFSAWM